MPTRRTVPLLDYLAAVDDEPDDMTTEQLAQLVHLTERITITFDMTDKVHVDFPLRPEGDITARATITENGWVVITVGAR